MFTDTIKVYFSNFIIEQTIIENIVLKNTIIYRTNKTGLLFHTCYGQPTSAIVVNNSFSLLAEVNQYSSVSGTFFIDGRFDDLFEFYLNDSLIDTHAFGFVGNDWNYYLSNNCPISYVNRGQYSRQIQLDKKDNTLKIQAVNPAGEGLAYIYDAYVSVTTISK